MEIEKTYELIHISITPKLLILEVCCPWVSYREFYAIQKNLCIEIWKAKHSQHTLHPYIRGPLVHLSHSTNKKHSYFLTFPSICWVREVFPVTVAVIPISDYHTEQIKTVSQIMQYLTSLCSPAYVLFSS